MSTHYRRFTRSLSLMGAAALAAGLVGALPAGQASAAGGVPRYDHVVIVMEENHSYSEIIGSGTGAPYINNTLAAGGALFTQSFAIEHPSEPNYLDLFSGGNQGVVDDSCPHTFSTANEGAQLITAGDTFTGYSEDLPSAGSTVCTSGAYARKHNPWVNFSNVPAADNQPFTSFPSSANFASLPTVSWVVPNLNNDMHDGTIAQGDTWLQNNMDAYAQWAKTHNSLLVVTWDEDDSSMSNQIPTIFYGANVKPGQYSETINHYSVLRTVEDMYGLPYAGAAASATPITDVFGTTAPDFSIAASPTSGTVTAGSSATSTISTTALGGFTGNVSLTASGAPAGATATLNPTSVAAGGSSTLTVTTSSSTPAGTYPITVTGTSGSLSHSTTYSLTVNQPVTGGITNGGFETGTFSGWTTTGTAAVVNTGAHSGTYAARLGSTSATNGDSTAAQTFTAPTGSSSLSLWYNVTCPDRVRHDWATATLTDTTTGVTTRILAKTCVASSGWRNVTAPVTAGHNYSLTLVSHDDNVAGNPTYTLYDDVTLS